MFWSGEKLRAELHKNSIITDYDERRVDHACYKMRVGAEVYVSPTGEPGDSRNKPKTLLASGPAPDFLGDTFAIPSGQFGFIITEETVTIPSNVLAFISMRATYKFQGLVNVSGFHVDPTYKGKLIFSVFNAGPNAVHLRRGEQCFQIWFADLSSPCKEGETSGYNEIPSKLIGPIAEGVQSFSSLNSKIDESAKKLSDRVGTLEREQAVIKWASALAIGALVTLGLKNCSATPTTATSVMYTPAPSVPALAQPSPTVSVPLAAQPGPASTQPTPLSAPSTVPPIRTAPMPQPSAAP
jgi:dCTP deaminase